MSANRGYRQWYDIPKSRGAPTPTGLDSQTGYGSSPSQPCLQYHRNIVLCWLSSTNNHPPKESSMSSKVLSISRSTRVCGKSFQRRNGSGKSSMPTKICSTVSEMWKISWMPSSLGVSPWAPAACAAGRPTHDVSQTGPTATLNCLPLRRGPTAAGSSSSHKDQRSPMQGGVFGPDGPGYMSDTVDIREIAGGDHRLSLSSAFGPPVEHRFALLSPSDA